MLAIAAFVIQEELSGKTIAEEGALQRQSLC